MIRIAAKEITVATAIFCTWASVADGFERRVAVVL
jgi:hypothetical protein